MGYVDAISELIDFRKVNGASDAVLRKFCHRVVPQKSAQDGGKDDEIAVDARSGH